MSKPWVATNAQGRQVGRFAREIDADMAYGEAIKAGMIKVQYRPRKKKAAPKEFPYMGNGRLK